MIAQRSKTLVLLLGSNIGDKSDHLEKAIERLTEALGEPVAVSKPLETEPWGFTDQESFVNQAIAFESNQRPSVLLDTVLTIEQQLGRKREIKWGPRVIDIDIIFYGNLVYQSDVLEIPHPYMQDRMFVLTPLSEIMPDFRHPLLDKTIRELKEDLMQREGNVG